MRIISTPTLTAFAAIAFAACSAPAPNQTADAEQATPTKQVTKAPVETDIGNEEKLIGAVAGTYELEKTHAFLTWSVGHGGGLSQYQADFTDYDIEIEFDPSDVTKNSVKVTINPMKLETNYPGDYKAGHADSGFDTWNQDIAENDKWLNATAFPSITFTSTSINRTGVYTGDITGDLTFLGVTKPVTVQATFNGHGKSRGEAKTPKLGFDAQTVIKRSDFGNTTYMGPIGDDVTIRFSGEFDKVG